MNKHDAHYLNCIDENCEKICCVDRRNNEQLQAEVEKLRDKFHEAAILLSKRVRQCAEYGKALQHERENVARLSEALNELHLKLVPKLLRMDGRESWTIQQRFIDDVATRALDWLKKRREG